MIRSRFARLAGPLACGALLAGCGGGGPSTSSTAAGPGAPAAGSTTSATPGLPALSGAALAQAVSLCKNQIKAQSTLPAAPKARLEAVCEKAAKGDSAAVRKAAREVCEEVVAGSSVPAGGAKEQALSACRAK